MPIPIAAVLAAAQGVAGIIQTISGASKAKKLMAQRTAYKTPEELFKLLQFTQSNLGSTSKRDFQTGQLDRTFSQIMGGATRLGGNPNLFSSLHEQKFNASLKIGDEFQRDNMLLYDKYSQALQLLADNDAAEQKDRARILDNDIAAAAGEKAAGIQNIGSAANAAISLSASGKTDDLYKKIAEALGIQSGGGASSMQGITTDSLMKAKFG